MSPIQKPTIYARRSGVPRSAVIIDSVPGALRELYFIEHPTEDEHTEGIETKVRSFIAGWERETVWAYYPWRDTAVHIPDEEIYGLLRTARNRNLITAEEQKAYREGVVGIGGLSVGSLAVAALVATGGPRKMKLADPDTVGITNLNRLRATLPDVGENKTVVAARSAWEVDPFLDLELLEEGIGKDTIDTFLSRPRLSVFVDEMDSIETKILARERCKEAEIPVVMATDNGDSVIIDVERFDLERARPIFHGRLALRKLPSVMTRKDFIELSNLIIDTSHFTPRQLASIAEVGKTLSGIPQLGTAAMLAGSAIAYVVRRILTDAPLPSGRYVMSYEQTFPPPLSRAR